MKGRKKIPDEIKKLRGTDQPCRLSGETNSMMVIESIDDTSGMKMMQTVGAKRIFKEKANQLIQMKTLTEMDMEQLAIYCNSVDMLFTCMRDLKKEGKFIEIKDKEGIVKRYVPNPNLNLYKDLVMIINKVGSEFGFSPVSRMKFNHKPEEKDPLQALMNQFE